jgi:N-acetyl sugar amidotransferase
MKYCTRCLYPENHPLNLVFNSEGVCSGCVVHEEKDLLDWRKREERLITILDNYRNTSGKNYDCIIPVSGARDSYFIVHKVKREYGMNPLLVTYNKHYNTAEGIQNLARLRITFDCDIMTLTVNPETVKKITRASIRKMGSIYWHCLAGQTVFPVQIAVKFKIPLIIWGAHQGIDQVGMFSHLNEVEMTRKYRKEHDLMGYEAEDLIDAFDGIEDQDIVQYKYPDDKEIERVGVRGIYLNNYLRWDTKAQHESMLKLYPYNTLDQTRTFDSYNDVDCYNYNDVHDYLKLLKFGYAKVVDQAVREIRLRRISREEGMAMVKQFLLKKPKNLQHFLDWIGITEHSFEFLTDLHRKRVFWSRNDNWEWEFDQNVLQDMESAIAEDVRLTPMEANMNFQLKKPLSSSDRTDGYVLIGKGACL